VGNFFGEGIDDASERRDGERGLRMGPGGVDANTLYEDDSVTGG
jgi:hypothetical protein